VRRPLLSLAAATVLAMTVSQPAYAFQQLTDAQTAFRTGRYDDAVNLFGRMVRQDASSKDAARGLVSALIAIGAYDDALEAAGRFVRANDNSAELANSLGEVLYVIGDREGAERAFQRASATASDSLTARFNLAVLHYERGEVELAFDEFQSFIGVYNRSAGLSSHDLTTVANAVRRLGARDPDLSRDALRAYDEAIAADPGNLEPRVLVAELFLERYAGTDAVEAFDDVLQLNPNHPRALLGMAKTALFNGEPNALELATQSLEVNENYVPARVFLATRYLQVENYDRAIDEVEKALEVNANSLEALSVLAAARYLSGDERGFGESRQRVLALNPRFGGFYTTMAEVSARNRLYEQAARFARLATEIDSLSWRGYALLGMNELRNGRMRDGRANLERAFAGDPYDVWTKNTLDLLDTLDLYPETTTRRFKLFIDGTESELLSLYLSGIAEEAYDRLSQKYGYEPPTPIRVEVFPDEVDFSVRTVGLVGLRALGVSFGPVVAIISPSAKGEGYFNWGSTLWHELSHTFHMGVSEFKVPRWFTEGLSVLEERRARPGWGDDANPGFLAAYLQGRLLDVSELNNGFTRPAYPEQLGYSYYQASLVCELIERDYGFGALVEFLQGYGAAYSSAELFRSVLGTDLEQFNETFDTYMRERFATPLAALRVQVEGDSVVRPSRDRLLERARSDSNDYLAQLGAGTLLAREGDQDGALAHLERAKSLFPEYAGEGSPHWYLAQIYEGRGEPKRAVSELLALTSIDERHYAARIELADLLLELGDRDGAERALEELHYIHPMNIDLHVRLAELLVESQRWPEAIRERQAVLALNPVDRADALYQLAKTHFDSGDLENARRCVIRALEGAPNYQEAQELLLEIYDRRGQTR
jgi:tetratricopeptide (TPR) repeat protein